MDRTMFKEFLKNYHYVVNNSEYVKIDYQKIDNLIKNTNIDNTNHWYSNNPYNLFDLGIEKIVNMMLLLHSIDYSFWGEPKWTIDTKFGKKDGFDALLFLMIKFANTNNTLDFTKVSYKEFKKLFKGNVDIPLLRQRYQTLIEVSDIVNKKMNSDFYVFTKDIKEDTELFNIVVNNFPSFKDERVYKGKVIYFYKLAQLLISDILHLREELEGVEVDYSNLLGCADYKIPQTMRALDILVYNEELSKIVDNKYELEISSPYEVEIRASMIVVIDYVKNKLKYHTAIDINDYFFMLSRKLKNKLKPYHLCRNQNY